MNNSQVNQTLDTILDKLPTEIRGDLKARLESAIYYTPKIGIMGKSGAGKSSLINAILGQPLCQTGGVGGCTRAFQEERLQIGKREIVFMDLPGIAENSQRHEEYQKLYAEKLGDLDLILWVIKVDDRANKNDEEFYRDLIKFYRKDRILFVMSQCDKAEPSRDWDYANYRPSKEQLEIIEANQRRIANDFGVPLNTVVPVACDYYQGKFDRYNIELLVKAIIQTVPNEAKSSLYATVDKDTVTSETKKEAKGGFEDFVKAALDDVIDSAPIPAIAKPLVKKAKDWVVEKVSAAWDYFFG